MIQVRLAQQSEIEWINQRYDEVKFKHSSFEDETIAVAECEGQPAGIGRLVTIDANNLELGGMYVFEDFQGRGVAKKIVEFLLGFSKSGQTIYCIPFEHLLKLYGSFGFVSCDNLEDIPQEILAKYSWCKSHYEHSTALMILRK